jgi:putative ABC transport system permease protein
MSALRGATSGADRKRARLRQTLIGAQMAVALLLMVAAGLFLRSLQEAANVDVGFTIANVDRLQIDTGIGGYRTDADGLRVVDALAERFRGLPGVTSVTASRLVPLQGTRIGYGRLRAPGYTGPDGSDVVSASWDTVATDFFRTLEIPIVEGRAFDARDRSGAPLAIIVNQTFANRVWPGQSAIGRTLTLQADGAQMQVVGVARDTLTRSYTDGPENFVYAPLAQRFNANVTFYVRRQPGQSVAAEMRRAVADFNPMLPVVHTETLESAAALGLLPQRLAAWIAGAVATIGLLLVAIGIYGLTAFSVSQRRLEIAIRIAVGAPATAVLWLILRQAAIITAAGACAGLALAALAAKLLESLLIGMLPFDPTAFGASAVLLVAIVAAAAWPAARRAARISPLAALRMH